MFHKLHIIRHGTTDFNGDGKLRGWKDVPLSEKGIAECKETAKKAKGAGITGLIHSDLTRAAQTASEVHKETGIPIIGADKRLRPRDLGDYTGKDVKESMPILLRYMNELANTALPGGESFNTFKMRCLPAVAQLVDKYDDQKLGLVVHHRNERLIKAWIAKGCPADYSVDMDIMNQEGEPPASCSDVDVELPDTQETGEVQSLNPSLLRLLGTYKVYERNQQMIHWQNRSSDNDIIHKRCDEAYKYAQESIDKLAERLVMGLDGAIPLTMCEVMEQSVIKFLAELPGHDTVMQYLVGLEQELVNTINQSHELAESADDDHTADMLNDFTTRHEEHQGFLKMMVPKVLSTTPEK